MPQVVAWAVEAIWSATAATAFTVAGTAVAYSTLIGYAVTIGASIAYSSSQNAKLRNSLKGMGDQGRNVMARDPLAFQRKIYGQIPVAGPIAFMHTTGAKNEFLHVIMVIAGCACTELGDTYFQGTDGLEVIPLDGTGTNGGGNATGKYAGYFFCNKYLGDPTQAADATLIAAAPTKWTAAHKLSGHSYAYLQFKYNADLYPQGMPVTQILTKGAKVLDPRVGITVKTCSTISGNTNITCATAGLSVGDLVVGSGLLSGTRIVAIDGGGTFFTVNVAPKLTGTNMRYGFGVDAWTQNAALCSADYMTDYKFGRGIPWARMNRTGLSAEANVCEEIIVTLTGTERRYDLNGLVTAESDALPDMLAAMGGRAIDTGGSWSVVAGAYRASTVTLTDNDLVGSLTVQPRQSMRESYSGVRGTYISPDNNWQPADFPAIKNDTYAAQDGDRRRWKDVVYPFTTSSPTSQRLAKLDLERGRQQIIIQGVYKLKAFQVQCCDTLAITNSALGWVAKEFEVTDWALRVLSEGKNNIALAIAFTARETAAAVYDWANGEETQVDLAANTDLPDPRVVPTPTGLTVLTDATTSFIQSGDGTFIPRALLTWNTPNNIYIESNGRTYIEYKKSADANWIEWNTVKGDKLDDYVTDVKVGVQYDFRIYHRNEIGVRSNVAGVSSYNTVSNYLIAGDTTVPTAPTGLTASVGTGKMVRLKWTRSVSADTVQYGIYRHTANVFGAATRIAVDPGDSYNDSSVTIGTAYFYWVTALDATPNESAPTASVTATPAYVGTGTYDPTAPATPTAPTDTGDGTYSGGNGVQFAFETFTLAGLPAGAVGQYLEYKRPSDAEWTVSGDYDNAGALAGVRVIGLPTNTTIDFRVRAYSAFGISSLPSATTTNATPNDGAPNSPTSPALSVATADLVRIPAVYAGAGGAKYPATMLKWTGSSTKDIRYYEIIVNGGIPVTVGRTSALEFPLYSALQFNPVTDDISVRAVNFAGVASSLATISPVHVNISTNYGTLDMAEQAKNAVNITGGAIAGITDLALADGGTGSSSAAGARTNLGLGSIATQAASAVAVTGGSAVGMSAVGTANIFLQDASSGLAGATTSLDTKGINQRWYDAGGTQRGRINNVTGNLIINSGVTFTAQHATDIFEFKVNGANLEVYVNGALFLTL